jgi:hypothetical protein
MTNRVQWQAAAATNGEVLTYCALHNNPLDNLLCSAHIGCVSSDQ